MTRFPRPHRDGILLAVIGLLGGVLLWGLGLHTSAVRDLMPSWVTLVPLAVMSILELLRRSCPSTALLIGTVALIADQFTFGNLATVLIYTDLMYAAVVYGTPGAARRIPVITGLITIAMTIGALAWLRQPEALLIGVVTGLVSFAPALTGATLRNHREAAEAARLRAEQTALLAEMDRTQAVAAERSRMARELHDMVANHLSAIAIHSTAALSIGEPKASTDALTVIRENSVQGLSEMRRLIGLLRDSSGVQEPAVAPSLDALDALLEQVRTVGAKSDLAFALDDGREPRGRLPAPVEMAAYRIVQESLTNVLKHASPGTVTVTLAHSDHTLTVGVTSPYGERPGPRAPGSGAGLVGMQERVALLGGSLEAGPVTAGDGTKIWQVRAQLRRRRDGGVHMTIRVLVAEDQSAVRAGLVLILNSAQDIEVVGEAGDLIEAVRTVARGEGLIAPAVTRRLIAEFASPAPVRSANTPGHQALDSLTRREREVLSCLGEGLSNADIAVRLTMAEATVKTHVSRLLGKLELRSRVQAAVLAQELGI